MSSAEITGISGLLDRYGSEDRLPYFKKICIGPANPLDSAKSWFAETKDRFPEGFTTLDFRRISQDDFITFLATVPAEEKKEVVFGQNIRDALEGIPSYSTRVDIAFEGKRRIDKKEIFRYRVCVETVSANGGIFFHNETVDHLDPFPVLFRVKPLEEKRRNFRYIFPELVRDVADEKISYLYQRQWGKGEERVNIDIASFIIDYEDPALQELQKELPPKQLRAYFSRRVNLLRGTYNVTFNRSIFLQSHKMKVTLSHKWEK